MPGTEAELGKDAIHIRLSEPKWVDALVIAGGAALMFGGLVVPAAETLSLGLVIAFSGYLRWRQANSELMLSDRGILLQSYSLSPFFLWPRPYYCAGMIPWGNLMGAGVTKSQMTRCLGLSLIDLRAFLGSRVQFTDEQTLKNIGRNTLSPGTLERLIGSSVFRLMGYTEMPRSDGEVGMLEWNRENYRYHIVIPGRPLWFFGRPFRGGPEKVAEVILERARIQTGVNPATD